MQLITDPVPEEKKISGPDPIKNLLSSFFAPKIDNNEVRINDLYHQVQGLAEFNRQLLGLINELGNATVPAYAIPSYKKNRIPNDEILQKISKGEYYVGEFKDVRDQMKK